MLVTLLASEDLPGSRRAGCSTTDQPLRHRVESLHLVCVWQVLQALYETSRDRAAAKQHSHGS